MGETKSVGHLAKLAAPLIHKQQRPAGAHHDQILPAIVAEIGKKRACSILEEAYAGRFRNVVERPIAPVAIKPVREAGRLTNVQVVKSVVVDIAD